MLVYFQLDLHLLPDICVDEQIEQDVRKDLEHEADNFEDVVLEQQLYAFGVMLQKIIYLKQAGLDSYEFVAQQVRAEEVYILPHPKVDFVYVSVWEFPLMGENIRFVGHHGLDVVEGESGVLDEVGREGDEVLVLQLGTFDEGLQL